MKRSILVVIILLILNNFIFASTLLPDLENTIWFDEDGNKLKFNEDKFSYISINNQEINNFSVGEVLVSNISKDNDQINGFLKIKDDSGNLYGWKNIKLIIHDKKIEITDNDDEVLVNLVKRETANKVNQKLPEFIYNSNWIRKSESDNSVYKFFDNYVYLKKLGIKLRKKFSVNDTIIKNIRKDGEFIYGKRKIYNDKNKIYWKDVMLNVFGDSLIYVIDNSNNLLSYLKKSDEIIIVNKFPIVEHYTKLKTSETNFSDDFLVKDKFSNAFSEDNMSLNVPSKNYILVLSTIIPIGTGVLTQQNYNNYGNAKSSSEALRFKQNTKIFTYLSIASAGNLIYQFISNKNYIWKRFF